MVRHSWTYLWLKCREIGKLFFCHWSDGACPETPALQMVHRLESLATGFLNFSLCKWLFACKKWHLHVCEKIAKQRCASFHAWWWSFKHSLFLELSLSFGQEHGWHLQQGFSHMHFLSSQIKTELACVVSGWQQQCQAGSLATDDMSHWHHCHCCQLSLVDHWRRWSSGRGRVIPPCRSGFDSRRQHPAHSAGGAGLWRSSFDAHGRDHSCERPPCGYLHLKICHFGTSAQQSQRLML